MTITVAFGWWLIPAAITLCAFGCAYWCRKDDKPAGDYAEAAQGIITLFSYGVALIAALIVWLIYALIF